MKALMNIWLEEMRKSYDMVVLNGQRQRYEYFGFTLGGVKFKYTVWDANVRHALKHVDDKGLSFQSLFEVAYLTLKHKTIGLAAGEFSAVMDGQPVTARVDVSGVAVERSAKPDAVILSKEQAQTLLLTQHSRYMNVPAPVGWFPLPIFWYKVDKF